MSFVDERDGRTQRRRERGRGTDRRTLRTRRAIALGGSALILLALILLIKGCRDSARQQAFKDYVRNLSSLADQSNQESRSLFTLLTNPGKQGPVELRSSVNAQRADATQLVERARAVGRPDELAAAHGYALEALELRRDGIGLIAAALPTALGDSLQNQATAQIAGAMRYFVASDVIFSQRVIPSMHDPLMHEGLLANAQLPTSKFIGDLSWLQSDTATSRIAALRGGGSGGPAAPGYHHVTLGTVTAKPGGQTLASGSSTQIAATPALSFDVTVNNQGENVERDVVVRLQVSGASSPILVEQRIATIAAGQQQTATIPLAASPPTRQAVTISVQVAPVPGEKDTSNTKATFPVVFSG
ncbi:MAG: hypothetical protein NVS2B6_19900 [Thermoleophilaceae bacterium]